MIIKPTDWEDIKINLCCGNLVYDNWLNLDPRCNLHPTIIEWDWSRQIPIADAQARIVYVGYGFMYALKEDYLKLLLECFRVLKNGGMLIIKEDDDKKRVWKPVGTEHRTGIIKSTSNMAEMAELIEKTKQSLMIFDGYPLEFKFLIANHFGAIRKSYILTALKQ